MTLPHLQELRLFCDPLPDESVIAACVAAKGRCSGGRLSIKLARVEPDELCACQAAWARLEPFLLGSCAVSHTL